MWGEEFEARLTQSLLQMREEMVRDIKSVGKELAIDIVSLNKKIDHKSHS